MRVSAYCYMRLSTPEQLSGSGEQRQLDRFEEYARDHDLVIDGEVINDRGVSAFRGSNVRDGELAKFLEAVEGGLVARGSYLLVESLDRLTRQDALTALSLIIRIVERGINIVTLADGRVLNSAANDIGSLVNTIVEVARSNSESVYKSYRVGKAWSAKRDAIGQKKLTSRCPAWLKPVKTDDTIVFEVDVNRAKLVKRIFEESASGIGNFAIAKRLNSAHVKPFGKPKTSRRGRPIALITPKALWHTSSVAKILANRAVLGEFQPHKLMADKRRQLVGPVQLNYFPRIIDDDLFYRAQNARSQRRTGGGGRRGGFVSNLFSGLARCAYCNSIMRFENKGNGPKGGRYLVCVNGKSGGQCQSTGWRYDDFEESFLTFVEEIDLASIVDTDASAQARESHQNSIDSLLGRKDQLLLERERVYELLRSTNEPIDFISSKLRECEHALLEIDGTLDTQRRMLSDLQQLQSNVEKSDLRKLVARLRDQRNADIYKLRATIAARLRSVVGTLHVAPMGYGALISLQKQHTEKMLQDNAGSSMLLRYVSSKYRIPRTARYFAVAFQTAKVQIVYPSDEDPSDLKREVVHDKGELKMSTPEARIPISTVESSLE